MAESLHRSLARRAGFLYFLLFLSFLPDFGLRAQSSPGQGTAPKVEPPSTTPAHSPDNNAEVSTRDTATTFKVRVNLVQVRVVVRDAKGKLVENLKREDFQVYDNNKPQAIAAFSVETPASHTPVPVTQALDEGAEATPEEVAKAAAGLPQRFVALLFDDEHFLMEDAITVRDAAGQLLSALTPSDRVGVYTTSGQLTQEFTSNRELLHKALLGIVPRSTLAGAAHDCPEIDYYQADLIEIRHDDQALGVATEDTLACAFNGDTTMMAQARIMAEAAAAQALIAGDSQTEYTYRHFEDTIRRLSGMPGQRIMIFVSPGFVLSTLAPGSSDLVDRAARANIVVNTLDARGLYTPDLAGDIADPPRDAYRTAGFKATYRVQTQIVQSEILGALADGTGGTYFHNRNDLGKGFQEAGAAPQVTYLLGFSPQNLKLDGKFHALKVTLTNKQKFNIKARRGYYAPRTIADPNEQAKQEIEEALFSQDEIRDLPLELHTQFFKKDQTEARVAVLSHLDLRGLRFRRVEGRNRDDLTVATAIFDENGKLIAGGEKIVEMRLMDTTVDRLGRSGLTVKSSFDIKPGTYLVRQVVRDAEGAQMAARNGAVVIPY
jgi:VWFA-related protein